MKQAVRSTRSQDDKLWRVGDGNYSVVSLTTWDGNPCVVKIIRRYTDRVHKKASAGDTNRAILEEAADIATEVCILSDSSLDKLVPWKWRPQFHAHIVPLELEVEKQQSIFAAAGFEPGALLYMERHPFRLDEYLLRIGNTETGAKSALSLLCDCLFIIIGLHRHGIRHNDYMMRNIMLRSVPSRVAHRQLLLGTTPPSIFEWQSHPDLEVVLIDFGLASVAASSPVIGGGVVTEKRRNEMYACPRNGVCLSSGMHPLEMDCNGFARDLVDLQCLAFNLEKIGGHRGTHPMLGRWCRQAYKAINAAQQQADMQETPARIEEVVGTLMPPVARRRIAPL